MTRLDVVDRADLVVVGDGPAGLALAAACSRRGIDVLVVGEDEPWRPTYGVWLDELDGVEGLGDGAELPVHPIAPIAVHGERRHELTRRYGVVDNDALRARLAAGLRRAVERAVSIRTGVTHHSVGLSGDRWIRCRAVVLATGGSAAVPEGSRGAEVDRRGPAWQTAFGIVLPEAPSEHGRPMLMDFRDPAAGPDADDGGDDLAPTFLYSLPVADGWLVEETVLAARPAIDAARLGPRLAARLGRPLDELIAGAVRTETVAIPMGGGLPDRTDAVVRFGAAAGYVHPATGFSVGASLRAAPRVAAAIGEALAAAGDLAADPRPVWDAVWPADALRTRALHDYGLERMLRFDQGEVREFFDRFFELPEAEWAAYLRIDAPAADVSRTMLRLFGSVSWPIRRRLATGNPLTLVRAIRR